MCREERLLPTTAAFQDDSGRHAVLALEESCEVGLVGEAGALRHIGETRVLGVEHATRALEAEMQKILVRRDTHGLLERAREVRRRKAHFAGEKLHRQTRVRICIHQLQRTTFGSRR